MDLPHALRIAAAIWVQASKLGAFRVEVEIELATMRLQPMDSIER